MNLLTKALIAQLAYMEDRDSIKHLMNLFLPGGEIEFIYIKETDTEAHIYRYGDNCVVAFAGTGSWKDIKHDIFFIPNHYKGVGYIHSGFISIIKHLKDEMNEKINKLFPSGFIWGLDMIGHSLGGAEAILAIDEVECATVVDTVTTFGCPNGFSRGTRKYLEDQYYIHNVINNFDPVTMALGITTSRPETQRTNLHGKYGHAMQKYIDALKNPELRFEKVNV